MKKLLQKYGAMFLAGLLLLTSATELRAAPNSYGPSHIVGTGTYTPSQTNIANLASVTMSVAHWVRVDNQVIVSGQFTSTTGATSTVTEMSVSLPVASTFTVTSDAGGAMGQVGAATGINQAGGIQAHTADGRADFFWFSQSTSASLPVAYTYTYTVK